MRNEYRQGKIWAKKKTHLLNVFICDDYLICRLTAQMTKIITNWSATVLFLFKIFFFSVPKWITVVDVLKLYQNNIHPITKSTRRDGKPQSTKPSADIFFS